MEPFVGGANVLCRVPQDQGPRIGADYNRYMVALHTALANGWMPPEKLSKVEYNRMRRNPDNYPPELVAFAACGCSFGSTWFAEYVSEGDRCRQSRDSCLRDAPGLVGAKFVHASYDQLEIPPESLIYCDPPYVNTTGYDGAKTTIKVGESLGKNNWNAAKFWRWADHMMDDGHTVFISEYSEPTPSTFQPPTPPALAAELANARNEAQRFKAVMPGFDDPPDYIPPQPVYAPEEKAASDYRIAAAEAAIRELGRAAADRWQVVWTKEVVSEFSASRGTEAKRETEKLFTRA